MKNGYLIIMFIIKYALSSSELIMSYSIEFVGNEQTIPHIWQGQQIQQRTLIPQVSQYPLIPHPQIQQIPQVTHYPMTYQLQVQQIPRAIQFPLISQSQIPQVTYFPLVRLPQAQQIPHVIQNPMNQPMQLQQIPHVIENPFIHLPVLQQIPQVYHFPMIFQPQVQQIPQILPPEQHWQQDFVNKDKFKLFCNIIPCELALKYHNHKTGFYILKFRYFLSRFHLDSLLFNKQFFLNSYRNLWENIENRMYFYDNNFQAKIYGDEEFLVDNISCFLKNNRNSIINMFNETYYRYSIYYFEKLFTDVLYIYELLRKYETYKVETDSSLVYNNINYKKIDNFSDFSSSLIPILKEINLFSDEDKLNAFKTRILLTQSLNNSCERNYIFRQCFEIMNRFDSVFMKHFKYSIDISELYSKIIIKAEFIIKKDIKIDDFGATKGKISALMKEINIDILSKDLFYYNSYFSLFNYIFNLQHLSFEFNNNYFFKKINMAQFKRNNRCLLFIQGTLTDIFNKEVKGLFKKDDLEINFQCIALANFMKYLNVKRKILKKFKKDSKIFIKKSKSIREDLDRKYKKIV